MSEPRPTLKPEYFDALYTADPDPWNFAASPYEQAKYTLTLNAMPKPRYRSALEVGCSIGVLTRSLASRCDAVVAIDAAPAPLVEARRRCADLPGVRFEQMFVPEQWPDGVFDLILLSEVVYYLSREDVGSPRREGNAFLGAGRFRDPSPLDRPNGLSSKWRRGCRSLHRTNGIDLRRQARGSICSISAGRVVARLSRLRGGEASERRAMEICSGNSAGLSNCRANSGLRSSMTLHASAECGLFDDVIDVAGRDSKFGHPVLIESKASRAMQSSQAPSP